MTSKHKMAADSVDTFVQRLLGEVAIRYVIYIFMIVKLTNLSIKTMSLDY